MYKLKIPNPVNNKTLFSGMIKYLWLEGLVNVPDMPHFENNKNIPSFVIIQLRKHLLNK